MHKIKVMFIHITDDWGRMSQKYRSWFELCLLETNFRAPITLTIGPNRSKLPILLATQDHQPVIYHLSMPTECYTQINFHDFY